MTEPSSERRLAAVVSADVAGYARLMGRDEEGTLEALRSHRRELIDDLITRHGGRIVKTMGDGFLIEFPSAIEAVRCSVEFQKQMAARNAPIPDDKRIEFRIGINVGDVIHEEDDIFGSGVNLAARLQTESDPGGICLSEPVVQHVRGQMELDVEDMGERALKNIERPVRVFRLRGFGGGVRIAAGSPLPIAPRRPSIAILPFRNLTPGNEAAFVADGIALGIQTLLVQLSNIFLVNACRHPGYRNGEASAAEALASVPVSFALEGAVQTAGARVRASVQVTELATGNAIWADRYDRDLSDVFALQDDIAREVASALSVRLVGGHVASDFTVGLDTPDAWEHFLRGINDLYEWNQGACRAAIPHFRTLAQVHPESALGACYLSLLHYALAVEGWGQDPAAEMEQAKCWSEQAVSLPEGNNGLGHAVLAAISLNERRHEQSLILSRQGVAYRSNCPFAISQLGRTETFSGDCDAGIKHAREALRIRMAHPPSMVNMLAVGHRDKGQLQQAIRVAQAARDIDHKQLEPLVTLCSSHALAGDLEAAGEASRRILSLDPDFSATAYTDRQPYLSPRTPERIRQSLLSAGLPV
ncbi:hypothetical protein AVO45_14645 [Ruegeria marisrubri]|uniref:Guanylate cyclase domain-containing protein n=2 Tax=Pseudomonadota TaxID=1224 RepID=A0A0X3TC19_9RHOB|nr:adenylate/guanylate cyclase domain-containing protein [Ruegeria marisrubri]KUJ73325.1 hypothetical protein AVO45_14645 [Ruegeria marisrubri]